MTSRNGGDFELDAGNSITIVRLCPDGTEERLEFPHLSGNFGEGALTLSPSERLLLFSYFSGQSEEAYRLFSTEPHLRELGSCDYLFGEAGSYAFSPDERTMLLALPTSCLPWEEDHLQKDLSGNFFLEFGLLRIHRIVDDVATEHSLRLHFEQAWEPNPDDDYEPDLMPEIDNEGGVTITLPWGRVIKLTRPISDIVALRAGRPDRIT